MKLLIVTYSYTPDLTPRAFRWSAVAAHLAARGHEVHVLCASVPDPGIPHNGATVHRVRDWLLNGSGRVVEGGGQEHAAASAGICDTLRRAVRKAVRALWRNLHWPDYGCGWVLPTLAAARVLQAEHRFDWVISSSHPFTSHLVALLLKTKTAKTRWFVDISDPYSPLKEPSPYNRTLYNWLSRIVENRVIAQADAISVTTDGTAGLYARYFPLSCGKTWVIPPLLSLPAIPARTRSDDGVLRLVFVGTLYRKLRSPRYLLSCFAALQTAFPNRRMELHFYGAVNDCGEVLAARPLGVRSTVHVHGLVARKTVLQAMVDADVLVNIGNDSETQLASKVVEYMAVGRPILNIISKAQDISVETLADYPAVLTIQRLATGPSPQVMMSLERFLFDLPQVPPHNVQAVQERYAPLRIALQYAEILEAQRE